MKTTLTLFILLVSLKSFGADNCYRELTKNHSLDSQTFQIYNEELAEIFEDNSTEATRGILSQLANKLSCNEEELIPYKVNCNEIYPGNALSMICYAETEDGYFFVSVDMMENFNIIFNRFD